MAAVTVRAGRAEDLPRVAEIQRACPEAARWNPEDYLAHDFVVAVCEDTVAGFVVARMVAEGESEILNLAVHPDFRRRSVARNLLGSLLPRHPGVIYLELRKSNESGMKFYETLGFHRVGVRPDYYVDPREGGIVMKFHSC